jgi:hypothetical protein
MQSSLFPLRGNENNGENVTDRVGNQHLSPSSSHSSIRSSDPRYVGRKTQSLPRFRCFGEFLFSPPKGTVLWVVTP